MENYIGKKSIGLVVLIVFVLIMVLNSLTIIETGNVGVKSRLGQIQKEELIPGVNFALPFFEKIEPVFTKTLMINYSGDKNEQDTIEVFNETTLKGEDKLGLEMGLDLIVEVDPISDTMADMFIDVGRQGFEKKVLQPVRSMVRKVLGQYNAENIMGQRGELERDLKKTLELYFEDIKYYKLVNIQLKKIYLPNKITEAIEGVQLAKQISQQKVQEIEANKAVAQSKVEAAKGEANSIREVAKAKADAITMDAEAQAKANKLIAESVTPNLIKYNSVRAWHDGGAKVPMVTETIPFIGSLKDLSTVEDKK